MLFLNAKLSHQSQFNYYSQRAFTTPVNGQTNAPSTILTKTAIKLDNPYTGEIIDEFPFLTKDEQLKILGQARDAGNTCRQLNLGQRKAIIENIIKYLVENREVLAKEITTMMGKPIVQSWEEIDTSIERCKAIVSLADDALDIEHISSIDGVKKYVIKEPLGTVLILSSHDFPILNVINHMVPAVLSGNSVLLKDSPRTPTIGRHFQKACGDSNIVQHFLADQQSVKNLYQEHAINYVVFMGSLGSAHDVYMEVAKNDFIDVQLDLGGKEAAFVAEDADQDNAIEMLLKASFYNTGQSRNSMQRIFVEKVIYDEFVNKFSKRAFETLKLGDPMDESTNIGPLATSEYVEVMQDLVDDAVSMGGSVVLGGTQNTDEHGMGRFYEPTIICNATNGMRVQAEQVFGPIVTFQEVDDDRQARSLINSSKYGVTSSIFTNNEITMDYFIGNLRVGVVNINKCPVMQDHYLPVTGRKVCNKILYNSKYAFDNFTRLKSVNMKIIV
eukprot:403360417